MIDKIKILLLRLSWSNARVLQLHKELMREKVRVVELEQFVKGLIEDNNKMASRGSLGDFMTVDEAIEIAELNRIWKK